MKKELEFLYEGNCNENPFVFETLELQEQMDSVFSYFQKRHAEKQSVLILTVPEPAAVSSDKAAKNRVELRCRAPRFLFPPVFSGKFSVPVFPCSFVKSQTTVEIVLLVEEPCSQILHISPTLHNSWYAAAGGSMHA